MGGFFGVVSRTNCVTDLFYGTDFHSHLGTRRAGLAVWDGSRFTRSIHDISNAQFRSKFQDELPRFRGSLGIGVISDYEDQPLTIDSHLGRYAIVTVGAICNLEALAKRARRCWRSHFSEMSDGELNPTEMVATLIDQEESFTAGLQRVQAEIEGSCSILLLTQEGIYASRDRCGRTPIALGCKEDARALTLETCALPNLGYELERQLGPGEIVLVQPHGVEVRQAPGPCMQICAFLWVYYGYPASSYEGINVEAARYRCGQALARHDDTEVDSVGGIPDSGTAHALGYATARGLPVRRPFVKYTPTWPRSFMPPKQADRDLVARMKLIPIRELIDNQRLLFCEDSIVRGTQLQDTIRRLYDCGAREIHMRPACPPLIYSCPFLNFSRSKSEMDLAGRRAVCAIENKPDADLRAYTRHGSDAYNAMVEHIRQRLELTSLKYQRLEDLVEAIGLPAAKMCTYCWDGTNPPGSKPAASEPAEA